MPLLNALEGWAHRLFGRISPKFFKFIDFKESLRKANIKIFPETYVSLMFLVAFLTIPISVVAAVLMILFNWIPLFFLIPTPIYVILVFVVAPLSKSSDRSTVLEREMPFASTYTTVMASGGIAPYSSFKRLAEVDLMPAMQKEAREVIKDVEIFGMDPLTAMNNAAKHNPLDIFRDFVSGYASTVIIGGDVSHFLETKTQDIFKTRSARVKAAAERLGMLLESFIIIMVLMSLCFYILFSVESIYSTGMGSFSTMLMYTYVFTPMLSIVFIYLAHNMQPKTPVTDWRPYRVFIISSAAAVGIFLLLTGFVGLIQTPLSGLQSVIDMPTAVALALFITVAPAAIIQIKISKEKASLEKGISTFLQDLTETRKTGLAPERCIETLSNRDYGVFSRELKKISTEITWGIPVRKVVMDFVKRTKSWMTQIIMFLLVETIDVGGGTVSMIESLARFNSMTEDVEKEKKMSVRPYVMIPYFAAVLLVATTVMTLAFTSQTLEVAGSTTQTGPDITFLQTIFATSVTVHCYLIGIVAGKISEESVAGGFKHAAILVLIALAASKLTPMFFGGGGEAA